MVYVWWGLYPSRVIKMMNGWLFLLLVPFAGVAMASILDKDDDIEPDALPEPEPVDPTQGTDGNDDLHNPAGFEGVIDGGTGDDTITLTGPDDPATGHIVQTEWNPASGDADYEWRGTDGTFWAPNDGDASLPGGLVLGRGGAGDDTLTGTGAGLDLDGGDGDDVIVISGLPASALSGVMQAAARGGDGNDTIRADGDGIVSTGGAGDDHIIASGAYHWINGGAGADRITLSGLRDSTVVLDGQDSVDGRGAGDDGLTFWLTQGAQFQGNGGSDRMIVSGGAQGDGGAGNDYLRTDDQTGGENTLLGGAGNDTLVGNYGFADHSPSMFDRFADHVGRSSDVLNGGDGDDVIRFDLGDTVTGGAGADHLTGFLQQYQTATITDFDPAEDSLRINLNPTEAGDGFGNVSVAEADGNTLISVNGQVVLEIQGRTGLSIGFEHGDSFSGSDGSGQSYTDLDGNPVQPGALDVIINNWEGLVT